MQLKALRNKSELIDGFVSSYKSLLAYMYWKETGDASVYRGIAQDSIVMNIDDLLCIGVTGNTIISSTINRNAKSIPGEVLARKDFSSITPWLSLIILASCSSSATNDNTALIKISFFKTDLRR